MTSIENTHRLASFQRHKSAQVSFRLLLRLATPPNRLWLRARLAVRKTWTQSQIDHLTDLHKMCRTAASGEGLAKCGTDASPPTPGLVERPSPRKIDFAAPLLRAFAAYLENRFGGETDGERESQKREKTNFAIYARVETLSAIFVDINFTYYRIRLPSSPSSVLRVSGRRRSRSKPCASVDSFRRRRLSCSEGWKMPWPIRTKQVVFRPSRAPNSVESAKKRCNTV